jgi:hypothetical protein
MADVLHPKKLDLRLDDVTRQRQDLGAGASAGDLTRQSLGFGRMIVIGPSPNRQAVAMCVPRGSRFAKG